MKGTYRGYDGPCPPWNDTLLHHYYFILYATSLDRCAVAGDFSGHDVLTAIRGHVLAEAALIGTYAINPSVR